MSHPLFRALCLGSLCLSLASCAQSQATPPPSLPLRALIVSGGPDADYNQYAIESNARYVESLTARARSRRILFADGLRTSKTISTLESAPDDDAKLVFAWLFGEDAPDPHVVYRAPTLKQLDGPATWISVSHRIEEMARDIKPAETGLVYFTGHGSPGEKPSLVHRSDEDYENTLYSLWNDETVSVKDLAVQLQHWPKASPLVLIMVQCHAGGFANVMFQGGNSNSPIWNQDFCGFFASTGDRQASGCTSEVDERDYQDFTTHFFAALSGISRDGRKITGADFDHDGKVSLLEAYAWTSIHDSSIDVPVCTSDAYLRSVYPQQNDGAWRKTPYSKLLAEAQSWQKAILEGLSKTLSLSGEGRVESAVTLHARLESNADANDADSAPWPAGVDGDAMDARFHSVKSALLQKFPGLKAPHALARYKQARKSAIRWLPTRSGDVGAMARALKLWNAASETDEAREAITWRFVRTARTVFLQSQLKAKGAAAQKAVFARLRRSESRNPIR